jgi:ArsR family transcriptional regulator, arsenate/arsenite/antimonite-responsive transcriptional repressor
LTYLHPLIYCAMHDDLPIDRSLLRRFQAVAEETRFGIVQRLAGGERCVCELQDDLVAGQSRLSFHLTKLKEAGVVKDTRHGRWVYYSLVPEALEEMRAFLGEVKPREPAGLAVLSRDAPCC